MAMIVAAPRTTGTCVGIGWSADRNAVIAGRLAAQQAQRSLGQHRIDLAILFASARYEQTHLLHSVRETIGYAPLIGGSDAGEIAPNMVLQRSVVLMLIGSDAMRFTISAAEHLRNDPRAAGEAVASQCAPARPQERRRALLMLADGLTGAHQELTRGAQHILGASFPIAGALTGDDLLFRETYQYCNDRLLTDSVVGVLISGNVRVGMRARHGWHPVGRPHRVTRATGNTLHELDGAPAARVYEEYLGQEEVRVMQGWLLSQATVAYPLGMSVEGEEEFLLRHVVQMTADGALVCAGDIREGSWIRLMVGTRAGAVEAARLAADQAREDMKHLFFALVFDSVARRKLFGRQAHDELTAIHAALGSHVPLIGCYTYGEQAPLRSAMHLGHSYFHNGTALVITVGA